MELEQICQGAKAASQKLATLGTNEKNRALTAVASALVAASADIIAVNKEDLENGKKNHMPEGLLDRLMLNKARIAQIAEGLQQVAALDDPIGEVLSMKKTSERPDDRKKTCTAWRGRHDLRGKTERDCRCFWTLL